MTDRKCGAVIGGSMNEQPRFNTRHKSVAALVAASAVASFVPRVHATTYADLALANATVYPTVVTVNNVTISNILSVNAAYYTVDVQDASAGTQLYKFPVADFTTFTPAVGDIVDITATNDPYQGNNEFSSTSASVSLVSTGAFVPAPVTTLAANSAYATESTLGLISETVNLDDVTITSTSGATTFTSGGTYFATDALGTTQLYIYNSDTATAALEGQTVPTGAVNLTAYVDYFSSGSVVELYPTAIAALPIPEPASLGLIVAGGALLVARRRNRNA